MFMKKEECNHRKQKEGEEKRERERNEIENEIEKKKVDENGNVLTAKKSACTRTFE